MDNNRRILIAVLASGAVLLGTNYLARWVTPKPVEQVALLPRGQQGGKDVAGVSQQLSAAAPEARKSADVPAKVSDRRLLIKGDAVSGSLNLRGMRLDDLELVRYRQNLDKNSPCVRLLSDPQKGEATSILIGWRNAPGYATLLPDTHTLWAGPGQPLTPSHPVSLSWNNGQGVEFKIRLALDSHYMFQVEQQVINHSGQPVSVAPYQQVLRNYLPKETGSFTAYEGPIGVLNGRLADKGYKAVRKGAQEGGTTWQAESSGGWAGITDKYWLVALGAKPDVRIRAQYGYTSAPGADDEQGQYSITLSRETPQTIPPGFDGTEKTLVFAGAKVPSLLQRYQKNYSLAGLDKAIDYGWFGFLTRPILYLLHWLYGILGNFGLALLTLTLIVKLVLFPLASRAAVSAGRMKLLAPRIAEIRENMKSDPAAMNQKIMALYKEEKINPAGGCLPMLVQAPIFFCLYKMLNVSIDERHAPFFGWIRDLSVPDPTNLFNLFGLLPFDPTSVSPFLHISLWGMALGLTFWLLQRQTMMSLDPSQARIMQFMPLVYVFVMSSFPAGLLVYYTWNNILTFLQQSFIQNRARLPFPVALSRKNK